MEQNARVARELHDKFFQGIEGLLLRFHTGTSLLSKTDPARPIFDDALANSDRVMLQARELMLDFHSNRSSNMDLCYALARVGADLKFLSDKNFIATVVGAPRALQSGALSWILRSAQEALRNAFRHAHANSIELELVYTARELRVRVRDDGIGIESIVAHHQPSTRHSLIRNFHKGAVKGGGTVEIWSRAKVGTEIEFRVPAAVAYLQIDKRGRFLWGPRLRPDSEETDG